jgi:hypothetical protein
MPFQGAIRLPGRRWLIGLGAIVLLAVAYLWAGYVLAPRMIRSAAMRWAAAHPGLALTLGPIKVDPIRFTASIRDIDLTEGGRPLATIPLLRVGVAPQSAFERSYRITLLQLEQPVVHARIGRNGAINLDALWAASGPSSAATLAVRIEKLTLQRGAIHLIDRRRTPTAHVTLAPVSLRLTDFRTWGAPDGRLILRARVQDGARLLWQGTAGMSPIASAGTFSLTGLGTPLLAEFLPRSLPMTPAAGRINLRGSYTVQEGAKGLDFGLSGLQLSAKGLILEGARRWPGLLHIGTVTAQGGALRLTPGRSAQGSLVRFSVHNAILTGAGPTHGQQIQLVRLQLADARFDARQRRLAAASLILTGLRLPVTREQNGTLNLMRWLPASAHPQPHAAAASLRQKWHFALNRLVVSDAVMPVRDLAVAPAVRLRIAPLSVTLRSLSDDPSRAIPFRLTARVDRQGSVQLAGRIVPATRSGTFTLSMAYVPLAPFSPYLPPALAVEIHSGALRVSGAAALAAGKLTRFTGGMGMYNVQLLDRNSGSALIGWQALLLHKIRYRPQRLHIRFVRLVAPVGHIAILPNRSWNLAALMPAPQPAPKRAGPAFFVQVNRLLILDGSFTFADESVEPHFRAPIRRLHGLIVNLTSTPNTLAGVALAGEVIDRFSPVTISGRFNLYGLGRDTDLRATFKDIQLPIFDPYSDLYAGYAIAKGELTTRFHYRIVDGELHADHHIIIRQLQWGGPSASKQRVGWPIRLATALLKNPEGVIRINLPVTGSLNDPNFHVTSIIWKMLEHLLEKAALAPFKLVGELFPGAQRARYVRFIPGSAALPPGAAASLSALAHALAARPALQVDIPAGPAGPEDAVALENARIDALIMASDRHPHPAGIDTFPLPERLRRFEALYRARLGKPPVIPALLPISTASLLGLASMQPASARQTRRIQKFLHEQAEIRWLRAQLRPTVRPSSKTLVALGLARAERIERALLANHKIDLKRVFLTTATAGQPWKGSIRLKLLLK